MGSIQADLQYAAIVGNITYPQGVQSDSSIVGRDLLEQVGVDLGVGHVLLEVGAAARHSSALQLVVHPAQQDGFWRQR